MCAHGGCARGGRGGGGGEEVRSSFKMGEVSKRVMNALRVFYQSVLPERLRVLKTPAFHADKRSLSIARGSLVLHSSGRKGFILIIVHQSHVIHSAISVVGDLKHVGLFDSL